MVGAEERSLPAMNVYLGTSPGAVVLPELWNQDPELFMSFNEPFDHKFFVENMPMLDDIEHLVQAHK